MVFVLSSKGSCYYFMGRLDEARAAYEEALRIERTAHGDDSEVVAASLSNLGSEVVAASLLNLGSVLFGMGMLEAARANYEEALRILRHVNGERHPDVARAFNNIGNVLSQQGQLDEALKMCNKALKMKRRVLGEDHQDVAASL